MGLTDKKNLMSKLLHNERIRKSERNFDKAQLLETLQEDLMKRKSCLIAYKVHKGVGNEVQTYDKINEVIRISDASKITQMLLLLREDSHKQHIEYTVSEYGQKVIKRRLNNNDQQMLKPDKSQYVESDTHYIDRNKTMNPFFTAYDNTSFENTDMAKQIQEKETFQQMMDKKSIFNDSFQQNKQGTLPIKQEKQNEDPSKYLFGAIQRVQPQASSLFSQGNPFNINFEIPPLPTLSLQVDQNGQQSPVQDFPSFFSFIKTPEQQQSSKVKKQSPQSNEIAWLSKRKSQQESGYNRRQIKQKSKKVITKKALIWNLLPHINEHLISHNLETESGMKRLWEDESLEIRMRDLRVCESGLLTQQKGNQFIKQWQIATESTINIYEKKAFSEYEVVTQTLLMLQGVPSELYLLKNEKLTFSMRKNFQIEGYAFNEEATSQIFEDMMESGSFFLHLREFTEFMSISQNGGGMILQNFVLAISDFLTFYYNQINEAWKDCEKRRQFENDKIFQFEIQEPHQIKSNMTLLELSAHMSQLQNQIKLLATICFTRKFIDDLDFQNNLIGEQDQNQLVPLKKQTYTSKNLKDQYQIDIDKIRSQVWIQNFPKGAQLLSYLYKILLCCESDLQAVDLLRRVFQRAIKPLLSMINSFIFGGDFEDPYKEFFVEKLFRHGGSQNQMTSSLDYLFKLSSDSEKKIPVFLIDSVAIIFKAGSSIHLLRKQGLKTSFVYNSLTDDQSHNLRLYYEICSNNSLLSHSFFSNRFMSNLPITQFQKKSPLEDLDLLFDISSLKEAQEQRQSHFETQTEKLQEMETRIIQQEEEYYFKQFLMREQAKNDYAEKRRKEVEKEQKIIKQRKDAFMRDIKEQMDQKQAQKDQQKLAKQQENEAWRKEQDDYQRRKKAIEEDLKRQYLAIIEENHKLADVKKENNNQEEEELEREIQKIMQERQAQEQQLQMMEIPIFQGQHKQLKYNQDVEMMVVDTKLKNEDEKLISENNEDQNNPLLSIINEALSKAQEQLNQSQIVEDPLNDPKLVQINKEDQDLLQIDEINILQPTSTSECLQNPESVIKYNESLEIIKETFFDPLWKSFNNRIDAMTQLQKKRQTWNKIRKDEKIQKFQEKRSKWRYQEPEVSIRQKLNSIFKEFESKETGENQQVSKEEELKNQQITKSTYSVPVALAIRQCLVNVVKDQFKLTNKCLIHLMFRQLKLFKHLEALKQLYLCNQGDIISLFMHSIFNDDIDSTVKDNSISFINSQFELSIKLSLPERVSQIEQNEFTLYGIQKLSENFHFQAHNLQALKNIQNFFFSAFNMQDYVKLSYKRQYPLDLVISDNCLEKYNAIFFFLIKLKRINQILSQLWKFMNSSDFRRLKPREYNRMRRIQLIRNKMQHFTNMLEQYALTEVIQANWETFKNNLPHQNFFEDLIRLHNEFLDSIMIKCFIDRKDHKIMGQITKMFQFVLQFNKTVKQHGVNIVESPLVYEEIKDIEDHFERYTQYLYQLVKHLAHKGQFKELFLRLDFNKFYDKEPHNI